MNIFFIGVELLSFECYVCYGDVLEDCVLGVL